MLIGLLVPIGILVFVWQKGELNKMELVLTALAVLSVEIPICIFFYYSKFETIVLPEGLGYRWWPLQKKFRMILQADVVDVKTRKSPASTYGVHWVHGYGWVHSFRGSIGFQFKLRSGKKLFLGTEKAEELKSVLEKLLHKRIGDYRDEF